VDGLVEADAPGVELGLGDGLAAGCEAVGETGNEGCDRGLGGRGRELAVDGQVRVAVEAEGEIAREAAGGHGASVAQTDSGVTWGSIPIRVTKGTVPIVTLSS